MCTHDEMFRLVAVLRKVEIVRHKVIFVGSRQGNLHIEFTPSFLLDPERGGFDHCADRNKLATATEALLFLNMTPARMKKVKKIKKSIP